MVTPLPYTKGTVEYATKEEYTAFMRAVQVHAMNYHGVEWLSKDLIAVHQYMLYDKVCMIVSHRYERAYLFVAMYDAERDTFRIQSFKSDRMRVWPTQSTQFLEARRKEEKHA